MKRTLRSVLGLIGMLLAMSAFADYPDKPIRLIVPFPAGGSTDTVARVVAAEMARTLGQSIIVDNRAGAGSVVGTKAAAESAADGYTLVMTSSTNVFMPYMYRSLSFKPLDDFEGIGLIVDIPSLVAVNASTPYLNLADLVSAAKARPGGVAYASAGAGTAAHLVCELFADRTGVKFTHVAYKGNTPAVTDLMGGHVPVMCNNLVGTLPFMKDKSRIRILAITGKKRSPAVPDVPTFAELGVGGMESSVWMGLAAQRNTPKPIISALSNALVKALEERSVKEKLAFFGGEVLPGTPSAYQARVRQEIDTWEPVVKKLNIKAD